MYNFYHRTNNIDPIVSSKRIMALKHIARSNPELQVEVELGSNGSNLGGLRSSRSTMSAAEAYEAMKGRKDVDSVFLSKDVLPPTGYGKYVIEKIMKSPKESLGLNLIPNEYKTSRSLSTTHKTNIYVPDEELEDLQGRYSTHRFIPLSQLTARKATIGDRAMTLYNKMTKSADLNTLYRGSESDIRRILSPNATIVGSEGIGINVPGSSDRDILIPYSTKHGYNRIVDRLSKDGFGLVESKYNDRKREGYKVYSYKDGNVDVDVAVVRGGKSKELADHVRKLRAEMTPEQKLDIIRNKERLQKAWFFRDTRYKNYKRNVDRELGLTQFHE